MGSRVCRGDARSGGLASRRAGRLRFAHQHHGGRCRKADLPAGDPGQPPRLLSRTRPRGRGADRAIGRRRRRPAARRRRAGRGRLLRPHDRSAGQGQAREVGGAVQPHPRRGGAGGHAPWCGDPLSGGSEGAHRRRDRAGLVDQLPDEVPGRHRGPEGGRREAAGGGCGRDLHCSPDERQDLRRDDHRADGVAPARRRPGQRAGGPAQRGRHHPGAGRTVPGRLPVPARVVDQCAQAGGAQAHERLVESAALHRIPQRAGDRSVGAARVFCW